MMLRNALRAGSPTNSNRLIRRRNREHPHRAAAWTGNSHADPACRCRRRLRGLDARAAQIIGIGAALLAPLRRS